MNVPTGYTALDMVGFTDKGTYNSATAYVKNDIAHYGGNLWRCLIDDTTGVTPTEGVYWTVFLAEPTSAAEDIIAQVETTSTAAHSYAVGKQLIYNDTLYTVTSAITVGDTLTVGTNITASDSIVDQLDTKANSSDLATVATTGAYSDLSGKPTLGTAAEKNVPASGDASSSEVVMGDDSRLTNARNAADVSAWAKAENKPTYNGAEILTSTAKTGTAQLSITDTVASGTTMDDVVGTMLNNDKTLDASVASLNEALTNEIATTTANGAHNFFGGKFTSYTEDGLIITANADGSVSVSGSKATASNMNVDSTNFVLKAGTYIFGKNPMPASGIVNGKTNMSVLIVPGNNHISPLPLDADEEKVFTLAQDTTVKVRVYCYCTVAGTSFNVTFKPLIRLVTDSSDVYTPYAKTNRELTEKLDGKHVTSKFLNTTNTIVTADGVKTRSQLLNELAAKFLAVVQALPNGQQARLMKMDGNAIGTDLTPIRKIVYDNSATSVVEEFNKINYDGSNFRLYHVFLNGTSPRACYANYNGTNWALNDMITGVPTNGNVIRLYYDIYSRV